MNAVADMRGRFERVLERARRPQAPDWKGRKFVVYGAGNFGKALAGALREKGATVLGFLDRTGKGQSVLPGLVSWALDSQEAAKWRGENPVVILGLLNGFVSMGEVAQELKSFGFTTVSSPNDYYGSLKESLGWRFWLSDWDVYAGSSAVIEKVASIWTDEQSRCLFFETVLFRLGSEFNLLQPTSDVSKQYGDPSVPRWPQRLNLVDGGAYDGDSLISLIRNGYELDAVHAFEPDLGNFSKLGETVRRVNIGNGTLWPCGLSSSTTRLSFCEGDGTGSKLASGSNTVVIPVVALDHVLYNQKINLIKLDIEGAEFDALRGASDIIRKQRPCLAVCLYHQADHLWSIPNWLFEQDLGYEFYLRIYQWNGFETVMYALPK